MRKRPYVICFYLSEEENKELNNLCEKTKSGKNKVIRDSLKNSCLLVPPPIDYNNLIREVRKVGNNIYQILLIARTTGVINIPDLEMEITELRKTEKLIKDSFTFDFKKVNYGNS